MSVIKNYEYDQHWDDDWWFWNDDWKTFQESEMKNKPYHWEDDEFEESKSRNRYLNKQIDKKSKNHKRNSIYNPKCGEYCHKKDTRCPQHSEDKKLRHKKYKKFTQHCT